MKRIASCLFIAAVACSVETAAIEELPEEPSPTHGGADGAERRVIRAKKLKVRTDRRNQPDAGPVAPDAAPEPDADTALALAPQVAPFLRATPPFTDVGAAVVGGVQPFECFIYEGVAAGSVPAYVGLEGCVLEGSIGPADAPGNYGFNVVVVDSVGAMVEVPVLYEGASCDTTEVQMVPALDANPVMVAGSGREWRIDVSDVDAVESPLGCDSCLTMSLLTRSPLAPTAQLACSAAGEICSDPAEITMHDECPGENAATAIRFVTLREHAPVRPSGAGWVTVELNANYSGASLAPCGGKSWACHMDFLELP